MAPEWFSDTINRHQWMWNLNARFVARAAKRMTDTDAFILLNEAVNLEIAETAAKRDAIRKARNSTKPTVPADQVLALLDADLARIQAAIDTLPTPRPTD